jgi:putative ABC transport system permease protein
MALRTLLQTLRALRRQPLYASVNVGGLALGLACGLLILLYAAHELRYDRHHPEANRLFRVAVDRHYVHGEHLAYATSSPPLAAALAAEVPQVELAGRLFSPRWTTHESALRVGDETFRTTDLFYGDPELLELLDFRFVAGSPETALARTDGLVLSESFARTVFGDTDPIGQVVLVDEVAELTVTGVYADPPSATHAPIPALAHIGAMEARYGATRLGMWGWDLVYTYARLAPGAESEVSAQLGALLERHTADFEARRGYRYAAELQPVTSIYLHSHRQWEIGANSRASYPYALLGAGLLVLLIAGLNYINLATARSARRHRSVSIHRILGGTRRRVATMLLAEATVLSVAGGVLALGLLVLLGPLLTPFLGLPEHLLRVPLELVIPATLVASALVGIAAGLVPALRLTRTPPALSLRGPSPEKRWARQALVTAQFAGSIALIAVSLGVYRQLDFLRHHDPGFEAGRLLAVSVGGVGDVEPLREALGGHHGVEDAAASSGLPGVLVDQMRVRPEGREHLQPVAMLFVDHDFVETLGLRLAAGRAFSRAHPTDEHAGFVVNEAAVRAFGWDGPTGGVGRQLAWPSLGGVRHGEVVGVLSDFHLASLRQPIEPLVLVVSPSYRYLTLRVAPGATEEVAAHLGDVWARYQPDRPLEYRFLDEHLSAQYAGEDRFGRAVGLFTVIALLVACLGLFGLAAFTAEQRTKEVGIRKVLGASAASIVALLSRDFVALVAAAFLVATPLAYLAVSRWLEGFTYRVELGPGVFLAAGALAFLVATTTVGAQALRAASTDPVETLRSE